MPPTLDEAIDLIWDNLEKGAESARNAFHQLYLATLGEDGFPEVRTMTLRIVNREEGWVQFNSDIRAPKTRQLLRDPRASLLFYSVLDRLQVRAWTTTEVHHNDDLSREVWGHLRPFSRRCYLAPLPPGTSTAAPAHNFPEEFRDHAPSPEEALPGLENFVVLRCHVREWDVYQVAAGHPWRAGFTRREDGTFGGEWRMP
jgi:pyridoxamine 5'-phosphate oxidase